MNFLITVIIGFLFLKFSKFYKWVNIKRLNENFDGILLQANVYLQQFTSLFKSFYLLMFYFGESAASNLSFYICSSKYPIRELYSFLLGWVINKKLSIDWSSQKILLVHLMFWKFRKDIGTIQSIAVFSSVVFVPHCFTVDCERSILMHLNFYLWYAAMYPVCYIKTWCL